MNRDLLQERVEEKLRTQEHQRTFSLSHEGEKVWVKLPDVGEANLWHTLLAWAAKLFNNNFFRPTVVRNATESLAYEASKLDTLHQHGIPVPKVLLRDPHYLVLEDAGVTLNTLLNDPSIPSEEKNTIVIQLSCALANMHNKGFYHSRPALRDIGYKEGKIFFLDFEENLETTLTTEEAIVRDGFIYIHALWRKLNNPVLINLGITAYKHELDPQAWDRLVEEAKRYTWLYYLLKPIRSFLGKDGVAIYQTLESLTHHTHRKNG